MIYKDLDYFELQGLVVFMKESAPINRLLRGYTISAACIDGS